MSIENGLGQKRGGSENAPKHDFRAIFLKKLEAIKPIPEQDREDWASVYTELGIQKLKREAPVLIFGFQKKEYQDPSSLDLWVTDPKDIRDSFQPHWDVEKGLGDFLGIDVRKYNPLFYKIGGHLLQDENDVLYLLVDEIRARTLGYRDPSRLLDLMRKYQIDKIVGQFKKVTEKGDTTVYGWEDKVIVDADLIGERRENLRLLNIAKKYNMTNTQFMRFRILAKSSIDAYKSGKVNEPGVNILRDVEEIAKEVVAEDKE